MSTVSADISQACCSSSLSYVLFLLSLKNTTQQSVGASGAAALRPALHRAATKGVTSVKRVTLESAEQSKKSLCLALLREVRKRKHPSACACIPAIACMCKEVHVQGKQSVSKRFAAFHHTSSSKVLIPSPQPSPAAACMLMMVCVCTIKHTAYPAPAVTSAARWPRSLAMSCH